VNIRSAKTTDIARIGDITVAAYRAGGHLPEGHPYEQTLRDVLPRLPDTLVAEIDDVVVGSVTTCGPGGSAAELARPGEWEFRFLAVSPEHWSSGVGRALISACEQHARASGAGTMVISVSSHNDRGLQVYPRLGYQRVTERDWSPDGGGTLLLAFHKVLSDQSVE
jgi:ribosomal protein S18 acetylase RimI-like enzyme